MLYQLSYTPVAISSQRESSDGSEIAAVKNLERETLQEPETGV